MLLVGAVPLTEAYQTIDWNTLIFLLGIMILVAHFQISGFFDWIAVHVAAVATIPLVCALAGNGTWLAYVLATVAILLVAWCIGRFARYSSSPG